MAARYTPLAWIPNTSGYRCIVVDRTGKEHPARVTRGDAGGYRLALPDGITYNNLTGWRAA